MKINPDYDSLIPKPEKDDYEALKQSIKESGMYSPIIINQDGTILDGHTRYRICHELGITPKTETMRFESPLHEKKFVIECNLKRRHLNTFQKVELAMPLIEIEKEIAAQNEKAGKPTPPSNEGGVKPIGAAERIAPKIGVSRPTLERAMAVMQKAKPEEKEQLRSGKATIGKVYTDIRLREKREKIAKEATEPPKLTGKYDLIYADPPWRYDGAIGPTRSVENQYPTMETEEICRMSVPSEENAVLFLWATPNKLQDAFEVMEAWGFTHKANMVWVKDKIGMGLTVRYAHEHLLIGIKGKVESPLPENRPSSVINAARGKHSEKPKLHPTMEKMYPFMKKRLELFARETVAGWTPYGNQV